MILGGKGEGYSLRERERLWYLGRENVIASGTPTQKFLAFFEPKGFLVLH